MDATHLNPQEKVAETVLSYYQLVESAPATATELASWVDRLPVLEKAELLAIGLAQVLALPTFKRYVLENRGHAMWSYMRAHLTPVELLYWIDDNDGGVRAL
ncbi:MAG: hypothetical protein ACRYFZ_11910 [Janthinobacterium lividum]